VAVAAIVVAVAEAALLAESGNLGERPVLAHPEELPVAVAVAAPLAVAATPVRAAVAF
jgi:hypothetical protein